MTGLLAAQILKNLDGSPTLEGYWTLLIGALLVTATLIDIAGKTPMRLLAVQNLSKSKRVIGRAVGLVAGLGLIVWVIVANPGTYY